MTIGERIKSLRIKAGITQEELANAADTTKQSIHKYETGIVSNIPTNKIEAIANKLQTTPAYLMGWESEKDEPIKNLGYYEQKKEVLSIKDQHPELIFYDDSLDPQIPHMGTVGKPKDQLLTGSPKYYTPTTAPSTSSSDDEVRSQNEAEMLQLFQKLSTRDQLKEIARLELLLGK